MEFIEKLPATIIMCDNMMGYLRIKKYNEKDLKRYKQNSVWTVRYVRNYIKGEKQTGIGRYKTLIRANGDRLDLTAKQMLVNLHGGKIGGTIKNY